MLPPDHIHDHTHGLVDPSIKRSREGVRVVLVSLAILSGTALIQAAIYFTTSSVALLADLIHNAGDALTAIPLGAAFLLRSDRAERWAGFAVVLTILASALAAGIFAVKRIINPLAPTHLLALGLAGAIGVVGNAVAARVRLDGGRRLDSAALIADGNHARADAIVSAGVIPDCGRRRSPSPDRRPDRRPRDHSDDPADHLGELAHGRGPRPSPLTEARASEGLTAL